jgi:hypothetical protein
MWLSLACAKIVTNDHFALLFYWGANIPPNLPSSMGKIIIKGAKDCMYY